MTETLVAAMVIFMSTIVATSWILTVWISFIKNKNRIKSNIEKPQENIRIPHPEIIDVEVEVLGSREDNYQVTRNFKRRY